MNVMKLMLVGLAGWSYHVERNHQGLDNKIIDPDLSPTCGAGVMNCRERLGKLLRYYYRDTA